jgi:methionyl-tRNA synthetase
MLSFAAKRFDGKVPEPGELDGKDRALLEGVQTDMQAVGELYNVCKFRAALGEALALARVLIARQEWEEAFDLLTQIRRSALEAGGGGWVTEALVLEALAHQTMGQTDRASAQCRNPCRWSSRKATCAPLWTRKSRWPHFRDRCGGAVLGPTTWVDC